MAFKEEVQLGIFRQLTSTLGGRVALTAAAMVLASTMSAQEAHADGFGSAAMQVEQATVSPNAAPAPEILKKVGAGIGGGLKAMGGAIGDAAKAVSDSQKGGYEDPATKKPSFWDKLTTVKMPEPKPKIIHAEKIGPKF